MTRVDQRVRTKIFRIKGRAERSRTTRQGPGPCLTYQTIHTENLFFLWLCLAELLLLQRTAVLQGMLYHIVSCVMASEMERPVDPTSTQRNSAKFVTKDLDAIPGERSKLVQGSVCMLAQPQRTHDIFRKFHRLSRNGHFTRSLRLASEQLHNICQNL